MDILKRKVKGEKREVCIYSQVEADCVGIDYVSWREAGVGDWALSDDGYVGECLDIKGPYTGRYGDKARFLTFTYGRVFDCPTAKLNYLAHKATKSYWTVSTKDWATIEAGSKRGKRFIFAYVMNFMAGVPIDWDKLGLIYRPDQEGKKPGWLAQNLFKQEIFKEMIQQKMIEVFKEAGKTEEDVVKMLDSSFDMAKANKDPKEMRLVTEDFIKMFDMNPKELPHGGEISPHIQDAEVEEIQSDIDRAKLELGQKKIETGETKEDS